MIKKQIVLGIGISVWLTGCSTLTPDIKPITPVAKVIANDTQITIPENWMLSAAKTAETRQQAWWQDFNSHALNGLVEKALEHNQNLVAAAYTWQKAVLTVEKAEEEQRPTFSVNGDASISQPLKTGNSAKNYNASLKANYQIDLWDKLQAAEQTAVWTANASAEDVLATRLSLIGEVVNAWLNLCYLNDQLIMNGKQIDYQESIRKILQIQLVEGSVSELDLASTRQVLASLQRTRVTLQSQRQQAQNSLSILLGQPPKEWLPDTVSLSDVAMPDISAGIPAEILRQRPDLRAAQYRLQSDLGQVAIAERDFYPDISLTGSLGGSSDVLYRILQNPIAALGASISLPFLQKTELNIALQSSQIQYQANLASFRQTLYTAFKDVENALTALSESEKSTALLTKQLADAQTVERLTDIRYKEGADSLKTLLDAQQARRTVEQSILDNRYARLSRRVTLYLALGGGGDIQVFSDSLL